MCSGNHPPCARPGYLIDAPVASLTPESIFTRMLAHHREVGLTCEQIKGLLDISREFHERQLAVRLEFAQVIEALELKRGRVNFSSNCTTRGIAAKTHSTVP